MGWVRNLPNFSPAVWADRRSLHFLPFPGSPTSWAAFCSWEPRCPSRGAGRSRKLASSTSSSIRLSLGGRGRRRRVKPPALRVRAASCSLSFWNHQLKPVLFFPSRAKKRMEFPFRETLLRALLGNRVNFHKIFPPKAEMSVSTSSNYMTIPFSSGNQIQDPSYP